MIRNFINSGTEGFIQFLYFLVSYAITITVHEVAHGYAAYKLGDNTAKDMGRLTLNPLKHLDIIGFIMMLWANFGWAKPVPIISRNFKNPAKGMAISALAGPMANFSMAFIAAILMRLTVLGFGNSVVYIETSGNTFLANFLIGCYGFFSLFYMINIRLGVFNLIPIPPLDGSRILNYFLPPNLSYKYAQIERYGFIVLILLLSTDILSIPLTWLSNGVGSFIDFILNLLPFLRV